MNKKKKTILEKLVPDFFSFLFFFFKAEIFRGDRSKKEERAKRDTSGGIL